MAIADDLKKTLADPTPLYFAAGTADLAMQQAKKVPALIEQLRAEAPARFEAVKNTDPKVVQQKAREAQEVVTAKVAEVLGALDAKIDTKKIGEQAQDLALRGVGVAAEYAVRAKETYDRVAEHGEQAVRAWRGEVSEEIVDIAVAVEPARVDAGTEGAEGEDTAAARKTTTRKTPAKKADAEQGEPAEV
ncbi:hypothetical protein [Streptomyces sp. NPDC007369]|uniref:hypothetical protein n=1 Tax=Streptomyces sp. NPDC007369 TaxID=3154589 RepID=UPI0034042E58